MEKIKVLHVFRSMNFGGSETFIMNVYRKIDRDNFSFDFLCTSKEKGSYDSEIKKLGGKILHYSCFKKKNPFSVIRQTIKIIKKNGPYDVIHIPLQFYSAVFCIAAKKCKIKTIIVHSHSAGTKGNKSFLRCIYKYNMRFLINRLSTVKLSCGEKAGDFLFGKRGKYSILYNGINFDKYLMVEKKDVEKLKRKYNIGNKVIIGNVGRFVDIKNQIFFIQIAKELQKYNKEFVIMLIGDGPNMELIKKKIEENELTDKIILTGIQKEVQLYYAMFDVFVMPSLYEGFPISAIEALASGTPCVLSNTITKEIDIIDDSCKFLDLEEDIDIWCKTILVHSKQVLNREEACRKLSQYGFSIESTVDKLSNIYRGETLNEEK